MDEIKLLLALHDTDMQSLRLKKQLEELPEAAQIMQCRAKRKELKAKQDQVIELTDEVEGKLGKLQAEEERVIAKINELQHMLDTTKDYRVTRSVTRDMEGQMKRQGTIATETDELLERQIKIDKLADTVADALQKLDHKEEHLTASFKEKGLKLKGQIDAAAAKHAELAGQLPQATVQRYEALCKEKKGIGLARLQGNTCSVCRSQIMEGELRRMLAGPALAECPNCRRMLVVREEEQG